jgi:hypothetical protein
VRAATREAMRRARRRNGGGAEHTARPPGTGEGGDRRSAEPDEDFF